MQTLIKKGSVALDSWTLLREASGPEILEIIEGKDLIVPMKFWNLYKTDIEHYSGNITVWLDSHEFIDEIKDHLHSFPLIALNFAVFADGRPYTAARELRQNLNYCGEIRAIGDVLRDQIFYMSQCGFDSFLLRHDQDPDSCIGALTDFKTNYQGTVPEPTPLFRRR